MPELHVNGRIIKWFDHELDFIIDNYKSKGPKWVARRLDIKESQVKSKAWSLGLSTRRDSKYTFSRKQMLQHTDGREKSGEEWAKSACISYGAFRNRILRHIRDRGDLKPSKELDRVLTIAIADISANSTKSSKNSSWSKFRPDSRIATMPVSNRFVNIEDAKNYR